MKKKTISREKLINQLKCCVEVALTRSLNNKSTAVQSRTKLSC